MRRDVGSAKRSSVWVTISKSRTCKYEIGKSITCGDTCLHRNRIKTMRNVSRHVIYEAKKLRCELDQLNRDHHGSGCHISGRRCGISGVNERSSSEQTADNGKDGNYGC